MCQFQFAFRLPPLYLPSLPYRNWAPPLLFAELAVPIRPWNRMLLKRINQLD